MIALSAGAVTAAAPAADLLVRSSVGVTPAAEKLLAELARPRQISVPAGKDTLELARDLCGSLTPTYLDLLRSANPPAAMPSGRQRVVVFPACFVTRSEAVVPVAPDETLAAFAKRVVGVAGPTTLRALWSANRNAFELGTMSFSAAAAPLNAETLVAPYVSEPVVYELAQGTPASAATQLIAALNAPPTASGLPNASDELTLESGVPPDKVGPALCLASTPPAPAHRPWPFDVAGLAAVLHRNDSLRAVPGVPKAPAAIAVADNGVDDLATAVFPLGVLNVNEREASAAGQPGTDDDGNGFVDDLYGTNIFQGGLPSPTPKAKDPFHGTHMAGLVLGGPEFRMALAAAGGAQRIIMTPISMVRRQATANVETFTLPTEGVALAIRYALKREARVVNLSVSTLAQLSTVEEMLLNDPNLLLVVASGNSATDLNVRSRYPAAYSDSRTGIGGAVITVAAHDSRNCLARFSGRGAKIVDIAAPGVAINSNVLGGAQALHEGTSQATAIVSFAAGLLKSEGLNSARAIKHRLLASVDLAPELSPYVRSEGALDIVKALSLNDDVLELKSAPGVLIFGRAQARQLVNLCVGAETLEEQPRLLKLSTRVDGQANGQMRVLLEYPTAEYRLDTDYCTPKIGSVHFMPVSGAALDVPMSDILDLVFS